MRSRIPVVCFVVLALSATPALAQMGGGGNPITAALKANWEGARTNVTASAALMAEADYGFRPVDSVRTFGQVLAHIAGANYIFCSAAKGEKSPHAEEEFEKSATTKAAIAKALNESMAYCDAVLATLDDKKAAEVIELPFGMGKAARAAALMGNTGHLQEHYGNLVTYFRIKGIVPPSSRRQ